MAEAERSAPALDDVTTKNEAEAAPHGAAKPHGDKLGVAGSAAAEVASGEAIPGDSPKRQGDKLEGAVDEAARG